MITLDDYLERWKVNYGYVKVAASELTPEIRLEAQVTVDAANKLLQAFGQERIVTSGWRPKSVNREVPGAAKFSHHMTGRAIDLADPDGDLDEWCFDHQHILTELELYLEHPAATKGWCHVQTIPPKSQEGFAREDRRRWFYP